MRTLALSAVCFALFAFGAGCIGDEAAQAAPARKKCIEKRVPVPYCVIRHRGRVDCTGKVYRYDKICK